MDNPRMAKTTLRLSEYVKRNVEKGTIGYYEGCTCHECVDALPRSWGGLQKLRRRFDRAAVVRQQVTVEVRNVGTGTPNWLHERDQRDPIDVVTMKLNGATAKYQSDTVVRVPSRGGLIRVRNRVLEPALRSFRREFFFRIAESIRHMPSTDVVKTRLGFHLKVLQKEQHHGYYSSSQRIRSIV